MGHTSTKMIDKHYAAWIPEDAPPMAKIANDALGFAHKNVTNPSQIIELYIYQRLKWRRARDSNP